MTRDREQWEDLARLPIIDLAVDPEDPEGLLMTDDQGRLLRLVDDSEIQLVANSPALVLIDWPSSDLLVGLSADGTIHQSRDGGGSWQTLTPVAAAPQALDVTAQVWHVATSAGLFSSTDQGRTWSPVKNQPGRR